MSAQTERAIVSVRATIAAQFQQVAREHGRTLAPLTDKLKLFPGLDSLGFTTIVARLADLLRSDRFNSGVAVSFPATFGDFVRMYETSVGAGSAGLAIGGSAGIGQIEYAHAWDTPP
jgi:hypothetical protein